MALDPTWFRLDGNDLLLNLKIIPRARSLGFAGVSATFCRVRLTAPPVEGAANSQLIDFLAAAFAVPRQRVSLERGASGQHKLVRIRDPQRAPLPEMPNMPLRAPVR